MADITYTASNVVLTGGSTESYIAGAALTQGQPVYIDPADGRAKPASANAIATAAAIGHALNAAAIGQPVAVGRGGNIVLGGMTAGLAYYVSPTAGGIAPEADIIATKSPTYLGQAISATVLKSNINVSGILK